MWIKTVLRALLKIPLTPFVLGFHLFLLCIWYAMKFSYWLYDATEREKYIIKELISESFTEIKNWFTTV